MLTDTKLAGLDDGRTTVLSAALVITVMVYVYPLRFVAHGLFSFLATVTGLPISSSLPPSGPTPEMAWQ